MKYLLVLSHLMSKDCILDNESVARAKLAIDTFKTEDFICLITSGWAYRSDCDVPISDVFRDYIIKDADIDPNSVISLPFSRDTVGDAFFILKFSELNYIEELMIVTSDYHVSRTKKIFNKFFGDGLKLKIIGAKIALINEANVLKHELQSMTAFDNTFALTNFDDIGSIYETLSTLHPFYNGKIYSKIEYK